MEFLLANLFLTMCRTKTSVDTQQCEEIDRRQSYLREDVLLPSEEETSF